MVRIPNEPADDPGGPLAELLRLQTQFQARLAEETLGYLRRLQGATAPSAPGTVLVPDPEATLEAQGRPGETVTLRVELENRQRVHCMVRPLLGELVSPSGVTWHPDADAHPASRLVAPGEVAELEIAIALPAELPPAAYRGALVLLGFRKGALPVTIAAAAANEPANAGAARPAAAKPGAAKPKRAKPAKPAKPAKAKPAAKRPSRRATGARDDPTGPA